MENQKPWEPTFPGGYTLTPEATYGGGMRSWSTPGPNNTAEWPQSETSAAPTVTTTEMVAPTLKAEPASHSGGQGVGGNPGRGGEGRGGGSAGEEE